MPEACGPPARLRDRVRRRRQQRDGHLPSVHRRIASVQARSASRRRARASRPAGMPRRSPAGRPGVLHGNRTYLLQDENGQIIETHSVSAGLDYPGVGPEHAWLKDSGRASTCRSPTTRRSRRSTRCCRIEGIIPALESVARARLRGEARADAAEGQDPARQPLRPRRQGHGHGRAKSGRARTTRDRHEPHRRDVREAARRRAQGADPLRHRRRSVARAPRCRSCTRSSPRGADVDRARRAVLRSDGRRTGDPARLGARARAAASRCPTCSRSSREFRERDATTPIVLMGYANPIEAMGVDALRGRARRRPASTACWSSTIRPRKRATFATAHGRARHRADLPAVADDAGVADGAGGARSRAATSTTCR